MGSGGPVGPRDKPFSPRCVALALLPLKPMSRAGAPIRAPAQMCPPSSVRRVTMKEGDPYRRHRRAPSGSSIHATRRRPSRASRRRGRSDDAGAPSRDSAGDCPKRDRTHLLETEYWSLHRDVRAEGYAAEQVPASLGSERLSRVSRVAPSSGEAGPRAPPRRAALRTRIDGTAGVWCWGGGASIVPIHVTGFPE
jgi:hypothetical protein